MRSFVSAVLACAAATLLRAAPVPATGPVSVVTFPIPGHVESAQKGHFVELTLAMGEAAGLALDLKVQPPSRSIGEFLEGRRMVLFPGLDVFFDAAHPRVRTRYSFNCKKDYIYTIKGRPAYATLAALAGRHVGLTQGYPYGPEVTRRKDIHYETALSDEANVQKLLKGRIDAFIVETSAGTRAFQSQDVLDQMQFDDDKPVSQQDVYWAFQNTDEGRALANKFDLALEALLARSDFYQRFDASVILPRGCKP